MRHCDYRDAPESQFDAISSIGLTEHIGKANLRDYFASLHTRLRPEGRLLNHCITQPRTPLKRRLDPFIARYVFPDGQLEPVGLIISEMNDAGFEVRHEENLREHYALTLHAWGRNLEDNWDEAVAEVGDRPRQGVAALHGRLRAGLRARQHPAAPGARGARDRSRRVGVPVARVALTCRAWKRSL